MNKQYFAKYLPVNGEIKNGDTMIEEIKQRIEQELINVTSIDEMAMFIQSIVCEYAANFSYIAHKDNWIKYIAQESVKCDLEESKLFNQHQIDFAINKIIQNETETKNNISCAD